MPTRVLLADEQVILRDGLKCLLRACGYGVVAEAQDGAQAVRLARKHRPDVAILDLQLPELNGIEAARRVTLVSPRTRIVFLTVLKAELHLLDALQDGVRAIVDKTQPAEDLLRAIEDVCRGRIYIGPDVYAGVLQAVPMAHALARAPTAQDLATSRVCGNRRESD